MMGEDDEVVIVRHSATSAPSALKAKVVSTCIMLFIALCAWIAFTYLIFPFFTSIRVVRCNGIGLVGYMAIFVFSLIMAVVYGWASSEEETHTASYDTVYRTDIKKGILAGALAFGLLLIAGYFSWLNTAEMIECHTAGPYRKYHAVVEKVEYGYRIRTYRRINYLTVQMGGEFEGTHTICLTREEYYQKGKKGKWKPGDRVIVYAKRGMFGNMLVPESFGKHKKGVNYVSTRNGSKGQIP